MRTFSIIGREQQNFDPYAHIDAKPGPFDKDPDVVKQVYHDQRAQGLVVEPAYVEPKVLSPGEQLRDLIYNAEGLSDADKNALANTAVNALSSIIKQTPTETFQPRSAVSHVNRR